MAMQLTGGTDLIIPPTPPRWFGRRSDLHVTQGEIRVTTGPAFRGARLAVTTPDALLHVTGTTFAVILEPSGTCVCVFEGSVDVGRRSGASMEAVPEGHLRYVFRDGSMPKNSPMRDMERVKLAAFREEQMSAMAGAKAR
jgi:ferric-dicitrate binding protein FerR (iron transport regulator)